MSPLTVVDFKTLFATLPGLYLILTPGFTIVAASDAYLKATMTDREAIIGRGLFEVFPDNPDDKDATGVSNLRTSLNAVLQAGQPQKMAEQKYDIRKPDGVFEERYWSPLNSPVFNEAHELVYIIHNVIDVTDQQRASQKLKKSGKDYQLLVSSVKDYAIFMVDTNGMVASWNSGAESIKGYTTDEIIGKPISVFYTAGDIEKGVPQSNLQMAMQYGHFEAEGWRLRKDGSLFWANIVITALKDEGGMLYGYSKITRDITEQKRLREQVNHLASIVEQSSEAIVSRGVKQGMVSWNRGAEILLGYSKEEAIGKTSKEIGMIRFTDNEIAGIEKEVLENGGWKSEKEFYHKNGSSFLGEVTANAVKNEQGEITSMVFIIKDISLRKQLEDQLKKYNTALEQEVKARTKEVVKSESRFRALIENSNDVVSLMDESFRIYYRSPSAFRITGWTDEDMIHADGTKNIHPDDVDKAKEIVKELIANPGKPINCLCRNLHKDGHYLWMEGVVVNLLHDESVKAIVFNFRDVTERIEAEQKLTSSENRFRALVENNYEIITLLDESLKIIYRSPSVTRVLGFDTGETEKLEGIENIHPDDRTHALNVGKEVMDNPGKPINAMFRRQHKNGHYVWLEGKVTNLLHVAQVKAIVSNFREITERIEAEEKLAASESFFRALIENSNDIITLMDPAFKLLYRSPAAARLTGWTNEDMIGVDATKNIHPEDQPHATAIITEVMANPAKTIHSKFRMRHKTGHYLWVEGTLINLLRDKNVKAIVFNFRDITARMEAEAKLAASEMRFRLLIENSADGIDLSDEFSNNIYRSPGAIKITGTLPKENQRGFTHPDDVETIKNLQEEFIKKPGVPVAFQARFRHELGHYIWVEGTVTNLLHVAGVHAFVTNFRDITQRKQAEDALKESEAKFRNVVENIHEALIIEDREGNLVYANTEFYRMFGYSSDKEDVLSLKDYTAAESYNEVLERHNNRLKGIKVPEEFEYKGLRKDGTEIWIEARVSTIIENDKIVRTQSLERDITERKKAEENLRYNEMSLNKAQAIAHIGNWEIDLVQNIHNWSDEFYRIYGLNKEEVQPSTLLFLSFIHPDDAAFAQKKVQEAFDSFSDSSFDFRFIHKDGITRHVYTEWKFEFDKKRKPIRLFGIIQDVTERKQAETERTKMINDLIIRNKDLEQFTYIVSHDLRAPLANILGAGNRLNDPRLSSEKKEALGSGLINSITKLDNVIKDLNNILQVKRTIDETKQMVCFSKLVEDIKISIQHLFDKNNIVINCDFSDVDEFLTLKSYLYSIFYNLISNSIKYRQQLIPGIIDIKSRLVKEKIELIFTDNGMGIDLQKKGEEVFGLYKRFHTDIEGKGMGLFMVKTQVETLGGKISIQSEVNKGTEFTIEFEL